MVKQLLKCLTACQLIQKKLLRCSQINGPLLRIRYKISLLDLFPRWSQAATFVFNNSDGVFDYLTGFGGIKCLLQRQIDSDESR